MCARSQKKNIESVECLELHQIRRFDSIFGQHLTILRQDAVIDHAVTLIGFGQEQKLAVATGEQMIWQELNRWHRRIDKWQAWACECKPFGPCRSFDKLDKLQSQLNVLLCLPSHLSCWGGSRRNSGLSKTPGANIGERQARDTWHRALIELCSSLRICGTGGHVVIPRVSDSTDFLWFPEHQIVNYWFPWLDDICGHSQLQGGRIRLLREDDEKRCGWDRQAQKGSLASSAKVCDPRDDFIWSDDILSNLMKSIDNWLTHWSWIFHVKLLSALRTSSHKEQLVRAILPEFECVAPWASFHHDLHIFTSWKRQYTIVQARSSNKAEDFVDLSWFVIET